MPGEATLVAMPGAVFSKSHDRIGYGGGYYDRYLSEHPQCRTMAVCHDLQIVDDLPCEPFDRRVDEVVTGRSL